MLSQGKIDQEEYDAAMAEDIQFANGFTISGKYVGSDGTGTEPDTEDTTEYHDITSRRMTAPPPSRAATPGSPMP